jgi:hypothetical protein
MENLESPLDVGSYTRHNSEKKCPWSKLLQFLILLMINDVLETPRKEMVLILEGFLDMD